MQSICRMVCVQSRVGRVSHGDASLGEQRRCMSTLTHADTPTTVMQRQAAEKPPGRNPKRRQRHANAWKHTVVTAQTHRDFTARALLCSQAFNHLSDSLAHIVFFTTSDTPQSDSHTCSQVMCRTEWEDGLHACTSVW